MQIDQLGVVWKLLVWSTVNDALAKTREKDTLDDDKAESMLAHLHSMHDGASRMISIVGMIDCRETKV